MLALHGRDSDIDAFLFTLAEKLGKTVREVEEGMDHMEYVQWQAFYIAKAAIGSVRGG